jgi:hypothetical protein
MRTNDRGHALLRCPGCGREAVFRLCLATTVTYPFVRLDGVDLVGDPKEPVYDWQADFEEAWCNECMHTVTEDELRALVMEAEGDE